MVSTVFFVFCRCFVSNYWLWWFYFIGWWDLFLVDSLVVWLCGCADRIAKYHVFLVLLFLHHIRIYHCIGRYTSYVNSLWLRLKIYCNIAQVLWGCDTFEKGVNSTFHPRCGRFSTASGAGGADVSPSDEAWCSESSWNVWSRTSIRPTHVAWSI